MSGAIDILSAGTVLLVMLGMVSPLWLIVAVPWLAYEAVLQGIALLEAMS